jgi:hypothetical protein
MRKRTGPKVLQILFFSHLLGYSPQILWSYRCLVGSRLCWLPYPGFRVNVSPIFRHFRAGPVRIVKWKLETEPSRLSKVADTLTRALIPVSKSDYVYPETGIGKPTQP